MLDLARVAAGMRVLDLATGRGEPAVRAAHRADAELVAWVRAFGLTRLLNGLPEATQRAWERNLVEDAAPLPRDGYVRLGGLTRIVVAENPAAPGAGR